MSVKASTWAWELVAAGVPTSPAESLVLLRLADRADDDGVCWPGHARTAADLGMTVRGVQKCVRRLQAAGLISVEERVAHNGKTLRSTFQLHINSGGELHSPPPKRGGDEQDSSLGVNGIHGGGRMAIHPHNEPPVKNHHKEPPPAATGGGIAPAVARGGSQKLFQLAASDGISVAAGGGDKKLFDLVTHHGLPSAVARRFVKAAAGASAVQLEALEHELPLRLAGARDKAGVAIRLGQLAARGELDDTTLHAREAVALRTQRCAEEAAQQALDKQRAADAAALRARRGPSAGELACRALSQKIKRAIK